MKLMQQKNMFSPIAIVVESSEDVQALWDLVLFATSPRELSPEARDLAARISNYLSNEAHL